MDKDREHKLRCERRALVQQAKMDKVERQAKREEFKRMLVLESIKEKTERTLVGACDWRSRLSPCRVRLFVRVVAIRFIDVPTPCLSSSSSSSSSWRDLRACRTTS